MDVRVGPWRKLSTEELMLLNCGVGEDSWESWDLRPLDYKEIQPVHPKGDQSWIFTGRTDVEAETSTLWPPDETNWFIWKDPDAGRDWGQEEKGMAEDEMVGWHHRLDTHEFGWTPGVGDRQGGLVCCDSWGRKESDTTEQLNRSNTWTKYNDLLRLHNLYVIHLEWNLRLKLSPVYHVAGIFISYSFPCFLTLSVTLKLTLEFY